METLEFKRAPFLAAFFIGGRWELPREGIWRGTESWLLQAKRSQYYNSAEHAASLQI